MVLSGVVPEILFFNFLGAWFTHSIWFPLGVTAILWFMNTVVAIHRNDKFAESSDAAVAMLNAAFASVLDGQTIEEALAVAPSFVAASSADLIITLNFRTAVSALTGVLLGLTVVWAFQLPPLLDPNPWHVREPISNLAPGSASDQANRRSIWVFNFSFPRFVIGGLAAAVGGNFLLGNFQPEVSPSTSLAIGIALVVFGVFLGVYTLIRWYQSDQPSDWLNFGYAIALVLLMLLPAVYDFLLNIRPYQGVLFQLGLALVVVFITLSSISFFKQLYAREVGNLLNRDVRYSPYEISSRRQWGRWTSLWIPLAIIYLVGWLVDEATQKPVDGADETVGDVTQVLLYVTLVALILVVIFLIWGYLRWRRPINAAQWIDDEDDLDRFVVLNRDDPRLQTIMGAASATSQTPGMSQRPARLSALDALKIK